MSATHRKPDGGVQVGPTWESLIERQIREAREAGAFDDLPHQGTPLPMEDDAAAGEWAMAHRMLRNAGVAPPWIEADKEARAKLAALDAELTGARATGGSVAIGRRRRIERLIAEANAAIERLNAEAPTARQQRRLIDIDAVLGRLD
jgi:hypothetical protein